MNGLLVINKPSGITSHDVDYKIKKMLNEPKVGHIGTLDPLATGVLVVCLGNATKIANFLDNDSKTYKATICFGLSTTTDDITGEVVESCDVNELNISDIDKTLEKFIGNITQTPSKYSAIKVNGKKLYEYARKDIDVEIPTRDVTINKLERISDVTYKDNKAYCDIIADVSKGTYIRTLIADIGHELGIPTTMTMLERTRSGNFKIENSYSLDDVMVGNYSLTNMIDAINLPKIDLSDNEELFKKVNNGMKLSLKSFETEYSQMAFTYNGCLIAIYEKGMEPYPCYKPLRVWN